MRWFIGKGPGWRERRRERLGRWHFHYAWLPTRVELQKYGQQTVGTLPQGVWLEVIERRLRPSSVGMIFEYRLPERLEEYPSGMRYWVRRPE